MLSISKEEWDLPRLSIPKRFRAGVVALATLPARDFEKIHSALQAGVPVNTPEDFAEKLAPSIQSARSEEITRLIEALTILQSVFRNSHVTGETFATDVCEGLLADEPKLAAGIDQEQLKKRILRGVVHAKDITITSAKIRELRTEVERSFCRARILTDIRTAFSEDASERPRGMAILHTLQIGYHEGSSDHKEFYVTLDDEDLASLRKVIQRAEKKKKTLTELLAKNNFRLFE